MRIAASRFSRSGNRDLKKPEESWAYKCIGGFMGLSNEFIEARRKAAAIFREAGIRITPEEEQQIVVNDFELGNLAKEGAQLLEWVATKRVNVRLIVLL